MANKSLRKKLLEQSPRCRWCNEVLSLKQSTIDHVVALADGGKRSRDNEVLSCKACNGKRRSVKDIVHEIVSLERQNLGKVLYLLQHPKETQVLAKIQRNHDRIIELKQLLVRFHSHHGYCLVV